VAAGLGALGHHDVAAGLHRGDRVPDLAAHVDHQQPAGVAQVDHVAGHAQPGHERGGATADDVAHLLLQAAGQGGEQVDAERLGRRLPHARDLGAHLVVAHRGGAQAPEPARLAHGRG
jgi:hypothetical protein